jgi:hypothetical protein
MVKFGIVKGSIKTCFDSYLIKTCFESNLFIMEEEEALAEDNLYQDYLYLRQCLFLFHNSNQQNMFLNKLWKVKYNYYYIRLHGEIEKMKSSW